jgi:excisionase family DNA binding protein
VDPFVRELLRWSARRQPAAYRHPARRDRNTMPDNPPASAEPPMSSGEELRWMSTRQAAAYLGITPRTLYRLIDSGQLPAYRFGRVFRLQGRQIDAFIDSARIQPGDLRHLYDTDEATADEDLDDALEADDDASDSE